MRNVRSFVYGTLILNTLAAISACAPEAETEPAEPPAVPQRLGVFEGVYEDGELRLSPVEVSPQLAVSAGEDAGVGVTTAPLVTLDAGAFGSSHTPSGSGYIALVQVAGSRAQVVNFVATGAVWDTTRCGPRPRTGVCVQIQARNMYTNHMVTNMFVRLISLEIGAGGTQSVSVPAAAPSNQTSSNDSYFGLPAPVGRGLWRYGTLQRAPTPPSPGVNRTWAFTGHTTGSQFGFSFRAEVWGNLVSPVVRADLSSGSDLPPSYGSGTPANQPAELTDTAVSQDGRFVVFASTATDLVSGTPSTVSRVYRTDLVSGTTTLVSTSSLLAMPSTCSSTAPAATPNTNLVAFESTCQFTAADTNTTSDIYLRDLNAGTTTLLSRRSGNGPVGDDNSFNPAISSDGIAVVFESDADNLVTGMPAAAMAFRHVYRNNLLNSQVHLASRTTGTGAAAWPNGSSFNPVVRPNGSPQMFVLFSSDATDIVAGDTNGVRDVFVINLTSKGNRSARDSGRLSVSSTGGELNGASDFPSVGNGIMAFASSASGVVGGQPAASGTFQVYGRSVLPGSPGTIFAVSRTPTGTLTATGNSTRSAVTLNDRFIAYLSQRTDLLSSTAVSGRDVYLYDRLTTDPGFNRSFLISARETLTDTAGDVADAPPGIGLSGTEGWVSFASSQTLLSGGGARAYRAPFMDAVAQ